jgi:hypothetical protein
MRQTPEHNLQVALFHWAFLEQRRLPELVMLFAVPNGGLRSKAVAAKLKAEGVKAGVPDVCLPVSRGKYIGLWIEMKSEKGKSSESQKCWHYWLCAQGHAVFVCHDFESAQKAIVDYLSFTRLELS